MVCGRCALSVSEMECFENSSRGPDSFTTDRRGGGSSGLKLHGVAMPTRIDRPAGEVKGVRSKCFVRFLRRIIALKEMPCV